MATTDIADRLAELLTAPINGLGLDLEGVDLSRAGKRSVLRVAVDKDGGVDMDDIAEATRAVSGALDDSEVMGAQPFTLEVSSPGVDRPLTLPRHWRRNLDRLVKVTRAGADPVTGRITAVDETGATLDLEGVQERIEYADVSRATVQIEFTPFVRAGEDNSGQEDREDS